MKQILLILIVLSFLGCSTTQKVDEWKNPEEDYLPSKVLVIAFVEDSDVRLQFEQEFSKALRDRGLAALPSIAYFEPQFLDKMQEESTLHALENRLMEDGFDGVFISKVLGMEQRVTVIDSDPIHTRNFNNFRDDFLYHHHVYDTPERIPYQLYHTKSSLYCLCPGKVTEVQWNVHIDLVPQKQVKKTISSYIRFVVRQLEKQHLL